MIYFVEDFNTSIASNAYDLAIIVLADNIPFSYGVSPVCIDWYNKYGIPVRGNVQVNLLNYIPNLKCIKYIKYNNIMIFFAWFNVY